MAACLSRCQLDISGKKTASSSPVPSSGAETAPQSVIFGKENSAVTLGAESKNKNIDDFSDRSVRWATKAVAAAATLTLMTAAPTVTAAEVDVASFIPTASMHEDPSLSIAIPIPEEGTWILAQNGFLARPPRAGERSVRVRVNPVTGGCPSWHPVNFETVVPGGVLPKTYPKRGPQWPALFVIEDETQTIYSEVMQTTDPDVRYATILEALLRMSDTALTCFRL
ncbi:hypothetical protein R1sor_026222 [Riccia sorocarpa]|uniref:Uncharacterized protein n=1 Tax=Riccia sorocarpa TaxID=122646 RepID=A0ABD3GCU8_9MARC